MRANEHYRVQFHRTDIGVVVSEEIMNYWQDYLVKRELNDGFLFDQFPIHFGERLQIERQALVSMSHTVSLHLTRAVLLNKCTREAWTSVGHYAHMTHWCSLAPVLVPHWCSLVNL